MVIDGCPLACARACLTNHQIVANLPVLLSDSGVKKKNHQDFDVQEAELILNNIRCKIKAL